jgi:hypothetical protein
VCGCASGCASGCVVRLCSEINWNDANATCSVPALHDTKSESAREGKIRAALYVWPLA